MNTSSLVPRRCMLLTPGANRKMIEKAAASDADMVLIDLDDAVLYQDDIKKAAQRQLIEAMAEIDFEGKEVTVRTNAIDTPWWQDDIRACALAGVQRIMPAKSQTPEDLLKIVRLLDETPGADGIQMWPMIETPGAIIHCERIAQEVPRLVGLCFGIGDYTLSIGGEFTDDTDRLAYPLGRMVCVARHHGLVPLAPVGSFTNMRNLQTVDHWARYLKRMGYQGALVIHPSHVAVVNAVFSPSPADIEHALWMHAEIQKAATTNAAALIIEGKLIEKVNLDAARRTLAIAEKLGLVAPLAA